MEEPQRVSVNGGLLPTALRNLAGADGTSNVTCWPGFRLTVLIWGTVYAKLELVDLKVVLDCMLLGLFVGCFFCWCVCWGFFCNPPLKTFVFLPEGEAGPAAEA